MDTQKHTADREEDISVTEVLEKSKNSKKAAEIEDALGCLASALQQKFQETSSARYPIEQRWLQDLTQYHGQYYQSDSTEFNPGNDVDDKTRKSTLFVNVTRPKTDAAEARMVSMLFPADDKNWELKPTPKPEMSDALKNSEPVIVNGKPVLNSDASTQDNPVNLTESDLAKADLEDIQARMDKMTSQIDDQLVECSYPAEARKGLRDNVLLGTMIIKGPMQVGKTRRVWAPKSDDKGDVVHVLEVQEVIKPYAYRVDPWNFYPDMTASCIEEAEYSFEVHPKTKRQMKELLKTPGFIKSQVKRVLETDPKESYNSNFQTYLQQRRAIAGINTVGFQDSRYQLVEYHGPIDAEIIETLGVDIEDDDPLDMYEGFVWFVNGIVVKLALHHLDSEDKLYSVCNWEKDDASIFGYGVPYTMRSPQSVISASWRMAMDNAGLSTGPQIVINREMLEPADGEWELTPRKIWYVDEEDFDVSKAFRTFNIESHQQELLQIFYEAKKLAEEETNLPMLAQGMQGTAGRTFSGMSMLMNASNITLKRAVKYFDDSITIPLLTRFYDWNMQFNPDNELKGDYEVHARGTGALMVKELQSQGLMAMMQYAGHPIFGPLLKHDDLLRMAAKSLYVDPSEVVKDKDTIEKEAKELAAAQEQSDDVSPDVRAKMETQLTLEEMRTERESEKMKMQLYIMDRKTEEFVAKLAQEQGISADEIMAKYDIALSKQAAEDQRFYDELNVKMEKGTGI